MRRRCLSVALVFLLAACGSDDSGPDAPPDVAGGSWTTLSPMLEARQEVCVGVVQGRVYVAGGFRADGSTANTVESYDPGTDRWTLVAPLPQAVNHCMAAVAGDRLYVIGGNVPGGASAQTAEYVPAANAWATRAPLPTPRGAGMAAAIAGRIFVAGGAPDGRAFEAYDPLTDRWTSLPPMPSSRNHVAGGVLGGRLFVTGGRPPNTLATVEVFDPATNGWSTRTPLPTGRSGHAGAVLRGCLYAMGGEGNAATASGVFSQNEVYDPRMDRWQTTTAMPTPRHGIGAAVVGDRIFVPGGATVQGFGAVAVHETFTPPASLGCE